jgi:hypothetical protein
MLTDTKRIEKSLSRLAEVRLETKPGALSDSERRVLDRLEDSSRIVTEIFMRQVYDKNPELLRKLEEGGEKDRIALEYFMLNLGPWDRRAGEAPFIGEEKKPPGVEFYPKDMSKGEFEKWISDHPEDKKAFTGFFTVIRRKGDRLVAVRYSEEYRELLERLRESLISAAKESEDAALRSFLEKRAEALLTDDYCESDKEWIRLCSKIDVVLGPYEVYEDALLGYKSTFESLVSVRDDAESRRFEGYSAFLTELDGGLPIDRRFSYVPKSQKSNILISNQVISGGDSGVRMVLQALNLPNDDTVRMKYGSKKVLLKNVMEAKFDKLVVPIARIVMDDAMVKKVTFRAHFNFVLFHEMSHGLGPAQIIRQDGSKVLVIEGLKELGSAVEEAKADIAGIYCAEHFIERGMLPESMREEIYTTYLANLFRIIMSGSAEAHAISDLIGYNYLKEAGAVAYDTPSGKASIDYGKARGAFRSLLGELLELQLEGDYGKAKEFLSKYAVMGEDLKSAVGRLEHTPLDIRPIFRH